MRMHLLFPVAFALCGACVLACVQPMDASDSGQQFPAEVTSLAEALAEGDLEIDDLRPLELSPYAIEDIVRMANDLMPIEWVQEIYDIASAPPVPYVSPSNCVRHSYNERWRDPRNPAKEHVILRFYCPGSQTQNLRAASTTGYSYPTSTQVSSWMIWANYPSPNYYQLFVDGWYYWPWRVYASPQTIFGWLSLVKP